MDNEDFESVVMVSPETLSEVAIPSQARIGACRSVHDFEKLNRVGEGTYGVVYRARDTVSGDMVAIKRVKMKQETGGLPISSLREITILTSVRHENLVLLKHVVVGRNLTSVFLVMEYCDQDLGNLLDNMPVAFTESQVKCIMLQIIRGIEHLHDMFIIHRDLKMSNVLMTQQGIVKIADFGMARAFGQPARAMSPRVVTLWYRSPELLLGSELYGMPVDCWALGCIMGELLNHAPLMPGRTEAHQIELIVRLLGAPNDAIWPGMSSLPFARSFSIPVQPYNNVSSKFAFVSRVGIDLINALLTFDPKQRATAQDAWRHPYFYEAPLPVPPDMMPTFPDSRNK